LLIYIAANWYGIHDNETGIRAYTWTVGRTLCGDIIHPHHDPHKHLLHESHWTNMGIISGESDPFPLPCEYTYMSVKVALLYPIN